MGQTKFISVSIRMGELLHDIMMETFLRGRALENETNYKAVANMLATLDEETRNKIIRSVKRALTEVKTEISEYLRENGLAVDNEYLVPSSHLELMLLMPSNFNETASSSIAEEIHAYICNTAVGDWYLATNKDDAAEYAALAARAMDSLRRAANERERPVRSSKTKNMKS